MSGKGKGRYITPDQSPLIDSVAPSELVGGIDHAYVLPGPSFDVGVFSEFGRPGSTESYSGEDGNDQTTPLCPYTGNDGTSMNEEQTNNKILLPVTGSYSALPTPSQGPSNDTSIAELSDTFDSLSITPTQDTPQPNLTKPHPVSYQAQSTGVVSTDNASNSSSILEVECSSNGHQKEYSRKPPEQTPIVGQIFYLPKRDSIPGSIIHEQKSQEGFFGHPVLIVMVDSDFAYFYAVTKEPPKGIKDHQMYLRIGHTTHDVDSNTLKLAFGSAQMCSPSSVNLEQCYTIEYINLDKWAFDVRIDPSDLWKLQRRIADLEAQQNRYLYKPLPRNMSTLEPGTVIMLRNPVGASTNGAPILIYENAYPDFHFVRIKEFCKNPNFSSAAKNRQGAVPALCLEISPVPTRRHHDTPVLLLESGSPNMREHSYVEIKKPQKGKLDDCCTWCWPPVKIGRDSMYVLSCYLARYVTLRPRAGSVAMGDVPIAETSQGRVTNALPRGGNESASLVEGQTGCTAGIVATSYQTPQNWKPREGCEPSSSAGGQTGGTAANMATSYHMPQDWKPREEYEHATPVGDQTGSTAGNMTTLYQMSQVWDPREMYGPTTPARGQIGGTTANMATSYHIPQSGGTNMQPGARYVPPAAGNISPFHPMPQPWSPNPQPTAAYPYTHTHAYTRAPHTRGIHTTSTPHPSRNTALFHTAAAAAAPQTAHHYHHPHRNANSFTPTQPSAHPYTNLQPSARPYTSTPADSSQPQPYVPPNHAGPRRGAAQNRLERSAAAAPRGANAPPEAQGGARH